MIIKYNQLNYKNKNVHFKNIDISKNFLPKAEVAIVRQVLQHLSNQEIHRFIKKLNILKPYKFLFVTENVPKNNYKVNLYQYTGPATRISINSGIMIYKKPFNLIFKYKKIIQSLNIQDGKIVNILYKL